MALTALVKGRAIGSWQKSRKRTPFAPTFIFEDSGQALGFAYVLFRFVDGSAVGGVEWAAKAMATRTNALARRQRR
jgi:hypothetical protein